jgi:hypothetical protein
MTNQEILVTTMRRLDCFEGTKINYTSISHIEVEHLSNLSQMIIKIKGNFEVIGSPEGKLQGDIWGGPCRKKEFIGGENIIEIRDIILSLQDQCRMRDFTKKAVEITQTEINKMVLNKQKNLALIPYKQNQPIARTREEDNSIKINQILSGETKDKTDTEST